MGERKADMRAGLYCWAGPGTLRMTALKFFSAPVERESVMRSYDADVLARTKDLLGLTDAWVTYSWGFPKAVEREDEEFLRSKLGNFRRLGIRTHAYVQGMNLVREGAAADYWCRDARGRPIPYHRGRSLCCPNNPAFRAYLLSRVEDACREEVDGVFVDNFHLGQFPVPAGGAVTSFGCHCAYCRASFGEEIPRGGAVDDDRVRAYIDFRAESMHALSRDLRQVADRHGKMLGVNGLDIDLDARLFYGYDVRRLAAVHDYLLVENFNHPSEGRTNAHLAPLARALPVPLVIVSYRRAIGRHPRLRQEDLDGVFSDAAAAGFVPCYKGSEFTTGGTWHNLDPSALRAPSIRPLPAPKPPRGSSLPRALLPMLDRVYPPFVRAVHESRVVRWLAGWIVDGLMESAARLRPQAPAAAGAA